MSTSLAMTESEVQAVHESVGLVDRSERGKLALSGSQAKEFLTGQVTNDVIALEPGGGCYAAFLTPKGKMLGDLRILDLGDELWLDTERATLQPLFDMIRHFKIGYDVELHKRTVQQALLSLVGPRAREVAGAEQLPSAEHSSMRARRGGVDVVLAATADGIDAICAAEDAGAVRAAFLEAGAIEVGEDAAELLRVEAGRPRYGRELDATTIPQEAGLNDRAVSFDKGCYVGQETVARLFYKGKPNRHLRGLRLHGTAATGDVLRLGEREVGRVGTIVDSPALGPIALAVVRREAEPGATLEIGEAGSTASVVELPFPR
jgi:folate-binding protein YgfZ